MVEVQKMHGAFYRLDIEMFRIEVLHYKAENGWAYGVYGQEENDAVTVIELGPHIYPDWQSAMADGIKATAEVFSRLAIELTDHLETHTEAQP